MKMKTRFDYSKVRVSWTKYDVVHVLDLVESREDMLRFYKKEAKIDEPIMRAFIGVNNILEPIPDFWNTVFTWDVKDRRVFAFFRFLFMNSEVATAFANNSIQEPFKGVFVVDSPNKVHTNMRSLMVEAGLASASYRRLERVPFDGQRMTNTSAIGTTFRKSLENLFERFSKNYDPQEFYDLCYANGFHNILGLSEVQFKRWTEGLVNINEVDSIASLHFDRFMCFDSPCDLSLSKSKEIYVIGENGDGKTVLLMALFAAFRYYSIMQSDQSVPLSAMLEIKGKLQESGMIGVDNLGQTYTMDGAPMFPNIFAYGTHRGRYSVQTDQKSYERYGFMTLFDTDMTLHDPTDWIREQIISPSSHVELSVRNLTKVLCELLENKVVINIDGTEVSYEEKGYKLSLKQLSEGYRSILIFVCDLLIKLSQRTPEGENVFQQGGVVMIDEIDQHLHPRWQRSIVKKLRRLFPNIQFIMTTHSPVIVLGSSDDAMFYRVIRENSSTYVSDPFYRKDMSQMMLNTLVTSSLFGLSDAAMDGAEKNVDTSDTYMMSRIAQRLNAKIAADRENGKYHYKESDIDALIDELLNAPKQ
ncbi:MAG: AAA family ATPase [Paludibacteraceae bacterium]|nr:AAA family ATPase [Paludibacteraceae bacterium]